jgi:hypothetical protein
MNQRMVWAVQEAHVGLNRTASSISAGKHKKKQAEELV